MAKNHKILTGLLWAVLVLAMVVVVATGVWAKLRGESDPVTGVRVDQPTIDFSAPEFSLTNQEGKTITSADLRGRPYLVSFIFTHCASVCPRMSEQMAKLQNELGDTDVRLVSFTVDPERDTPEVLKEYAKRYDANNSRWFFLTGTRPQMNAVAGGMYVTLQKMPDGSDQYLHSEQIMLVDPQGKVRKMAAFNDPEALKELTKAAREMAKAS